MLQFINDSITVWYYTQFIQHSSNSVIFVSINYSTIPYVVNNYTNRTELRFFKLNHTKLIPNRIRVFFSKSNSDRTKILKNLFCTSLQDAANWQLARSQNYYRVLICP